MLKSLAAECETAHTNQHLTAFTAATAELTLWVNNRVSDRLLRVHRTLTNALGLVNARYVWIEGVLQYYLTLLATYDLAKGLKY